MGRVPRIAKLSIQFTVRGHAYQDLQVVLMYFGGFVLVGDVPLQRVKFNAKHEYEYLVNYKVLQNVFKAKKLDKARFSSN